MFELTLKIKVTMLHYYI